MFKQVTKILSKCSVGIVLIGMVGIMTYFSRDFLTFSNFLNVSRQISVTAIVAVGMTFVILSAGIDLSVGSVIALTGIMTAFLAKKIGMSIPFAMLGSMVIAASCGLCNGLLISKVKIPFFITTLGMMVTARGLCFVITGGYPISQLGKGFQVIGRGYLGPIPLPVCIMIGVYAVAYIILHHLSFGRYVYALGGNEEAARLAGIPVNRVKTLIYTICGFTVGISALILTSRMNSGDPNMGTGLELEAIAAVIIGGTRISGGKGLIWGTLIGAYIMGVLNNGLNLLNVNPYYQMVIKGIIILLAVAINRGVARSK